MKTNFTLDAEYAMELAELDEGVGFCRNCGEEHWGTDPDARGYRCEECGAYAVYGVEEYLLNGWLK